MDAGSYRNERTIEDVADVVRFFGVWRVFWPALEPFLEDVIRDGVLGVVFQPTLASAFSQ